MAVDYDFVKEAAMIQIENLKEVDPNSGDYVARANAANQSVQNYINAEKFHTVVGGRKQKWFKNILEGLKVASPFIGMGLTYFLDRKGWFPTNDSSKSFSRKANF